MAFYNQWADEKLSLVLTVLLFLIFVDRTVFEVSKFRKPKVLVPIV